MPGGLAGDGLAAANTAQAFSTALGDPYASGAVFGGIGETQENMLCGCKFIAHTFGVALRCVQGGESCAAQSGLPGAVQLGAFFQVGAEFLQERLGAARDLGYNCWYTAPGLLEQREQKMVRLYCLVSIPRAALRRKGLPELFA